VESTLYVSNVDFSRSKNEEKLRFVQVARKPILLRMGRSVVAARVSHPMLLQDFQRGMLEQFKPGSFAKPLETGLAY
jgi:hypothetical protein